MKKKRLPSSVVIVGAGASGLFAARRLRQLGVQNITLLEKESQVGGKCSTYCDPHQPALKAERGAMVIAPNYGVVIEAIEENNIATEEILGTKSDTIEIIDKLDSMNRLQKMKFALEVAGELIRFCLGVRVYRRCCIQKTMLPDELQLPFATYAEKHHLNNLQQLIKPLLAGFGYGDTRDCPTYSVFEYLGYTTIPYMVLNHYGVMGCELKEIKEGFQSLMEKIAAPFDVHTGVSAISITRSSEQVDVSYTSHEGKKEKITADALILALSPIHWRNILGAENLTDIEKKCIEQLTYYRYPMVVCRLKGSPPGHIYYPQRLEKENFGHVAFISTRDRRENPEEGRLCSAYVNVLPEEFLEIDEHHKNIKLEQIKEELKGFPGVTEVEILEFKIWEDYFSTLPWEVRLALECEQYAQNTKTLYLGSYTLGSFEDVACVAARATYQIDNCFYK